VRILVWLLRAAIVAQLLYLGGVAWRLPVDYYDGYEYLMNARAIAGHELGPLSFGYVMHRPPLVPMLVAPVLAGYAPGGAGIALRGPHLLALALSALSLLALYRLLREAFAPAAALLGCLLLAVNPLFMHYAPFVMGDVAVMLFVTAGATAYLHARRTGSRLGLALAGAGLGMAMLAKYTAVLALVAVALFEVVRPLAAEAGDAAPGRRRSAWSVVTDVRPWLVLAGALLVFYLAHAVLFARVIAASPSQSLVRLVELFRAQTESHALPNDPTWEFAAELTTALSPPLIGTALLGMLVALGRRTDVDLLCLAWFGATFGLLTALVAHKEARYAFPVIPPLIYFVVRGLHYAWELLDRAPGRRRWARGAIRFAVGIVAMLLAVQPAVLARREFRRFQDPVYSTPFLPDVARWVLARSPPKEPILFSNASGALGFLYTMYPADPLFSPYDEFHCFHHISQFALSYLLDRRLEPTAPVPSAQDGDLAPFVERFGRSAVVLGSSGRFIDTAAAATAPEPPEPLTLTAVDRRTLTRSETGAGGAIYSDASEPARRLVLAHVGETWEVADPSFDRGWQLYTRQPDGRATRIDGATLEPPAVLELVKVEQREARYR